jgi:hypothetical protein
MPMDFGTHFPATLWLLRKFRSRRFWGFVVLGLFASVLALMIAIRVDQALFPRNAEELLSTIRKLQVGVTSQGEARQLLRHWPQASTLDGECGKRCWAGVFLHDFFSRHNEFFVHHRRLMRIYILLGGQLAQVRTEIIFVNRIFQSYSVGVYIYVAPYQDETKVWSEYALIGAADIRREPERPGQPQRPLDPLHPTYLVGPTAGCEGCLIIATTFTPETNSADVNRLMQFDMSCLNRWRHPCRTQSDIMPTAWKQFLQDQAQH